MRQSAGWRWARRAAPSLLALMLGALVFGAACTPLRERAAQAVRVEVVADREVQEAVDDVTVVVETLASKGGGWIEDTTRRFTPTRSQDWPLLVELDQKDVRLTYQVTATARDTKRAVIAQARVIADPSERRTDALRLRLDRECLGRAQLCEATDTCALGQCISARSPLPARADDAGAPGVPRDSGASPSAQVAVASAEQSCEVEAARACDGHASRTPLRCSDGRWQAEPSCAEDARCDSAAGRDQGQCVPIAAECRNQLAGVSFCDADGVMRSCEDLVSSEVHPCGENEQCVDVQDEVRCACKPGFFDRGSGCMAATDCAQGRGGCDALTTCEMVQDKPVCSSCPPGYDGEGATGCSPRLLGLQLQGATLMPAFAPDVQSYSARAALLRQRVMIEAQAPEGSHVEIDATPVATGWTSPVLSLQERSFPLRVISESGVQRSYELKLARAGEQSGYLKADSGTSGDLFGTVLAADGDLLVVGAPYEDSCAMSVDRDTRSGRDDDCANSGAAYVFERVAGRWQQRAYLKAPDARKDMFFGTSVGVAGDLIAVGAIGYDIFNLASAAQPGAAYVFQRGPDGWRFVQQLSPEAGDAGAAFGLQLTLAAQTLVVGAPLADAGATHSGVAYVFTLRAGSWERGQRLKPSGPTAEARFGSSLALAGEQLVVAAPQESAGVTRAGAVYHFERSGGELRQIERLQAPAPQANDQFGYAVALVDGGTALVVGAPHNAFDISNPDSGSVYVYTRGASAWSAPTKLQALHPRASDFFGTSVALRGDTLAVGASGDKSPGRGVGADASQEGAEFSGAVHVYARTQDGLTLSSFVKASNADTRDGFGTAVGLTEAELVVGANLEDAAGSGSDSRAEVNTQSDSGAVYVYR